MSIIVGTDKTVGSQRLIITDSDGAIYIKDNTPFYEQGGVFTFEADKTVTASAAAVALATLFPADTIKGFTVVAYAKRAVGANASTATFTFKHSVDGGTTWATILDSAGDAVTFDIAPAAATYEATSMPITVTGGLVAVYASCATNDAVVSAYAGWIPG